ncbi:MAG: hypothetical protein ACLR6J_12880 [Parabacteroides merdae]
MGDVEQIEPIWSISDEYSSINLKRFGLVSSESDDRYAFLHENGFLSSSGHHAKMARKSCSFEVAGERGAFLTWNIGVVSIRSLLAATTMCIMVVCCRNRKQGEV